MYRLINIIVDPYAENFYGEREYLVIIEYPDLSTRSTWMAAESPEVAAERVAEKYDIADYVIKIR